MLVSFALLTPLIIRHRIVVGRHPLFPWSLTADPLATKVNRCFDPYSRNGVKCHKNMGRQDTNNHRRQLIGRRL
ncbi:hypothetical protein F5Y15DRAFT_389963 [Xylariaceae sp. FL0016]|nr:hypothetical protein F5Y15DRAFT_389963 [Xylariaceae sp. FL0016]